jgi:O-acetyl-ADP-ribose deacetylase (regulator of RNase III)
VPLDLWLIHPDEQACDAFRRRFAGMPRVRVIQAAYPDLEQHDCFVTAGNAFGIMSAGIDAAVVRFFGREIMQRVQSRIHDGFLGEQPVGTAFLVETGNPQYPFLCHAPTMRVPGSIEGTDKVYAATWAAFLAVSAHHGAGGQPIKSLVLPAMGTGFGGMSFDEAARQMAVAYDHFLHPPYRLDWDTVVQRHKAISYDGERRVVR